MYENIKGVIAIIIFAAIVLAIGLYQILKYKGIYEHEKWLLEMRSLNKMDYIKISHKKYDTKAMFICSIGNTGNMKVVPFLNRVPQESIIIRNDQFIKKINK